MDLLVKSTRNFRLNKIRSTYAYSPRTQIMFSCLVPLDRHILMEITGRSKLMLVLPAPSVAVYNISLKVYV